MKLDGFGSFRLSFTSTGEVLKEDVTADSIDDIHIIFDADVAIKERVQKTKVNPMG